MQQLANGWTVDIERGPDWLFLRVRPPVDTPVDQTPLAAQIWSILQQHFTYRVVLELEDVGLLHSYLMGQLLLLSKRIHTCGGVLRVCGLSESNQLALRACRLDRAVPHFHNREEAVMGQGCRPYHPR